MQRMKRVALTIPTDIDDVLTKLSELQNVPKTKLIMNVLTDIVPVFKQAIIAIEQSKQGQNELAIETVSKFLLDAKNSLNQVAIDFDETQVKHGK